MAFIPTEELWPKQYETLSNPICNASTFVYHGAPTPKVPGRVAGFIVVYVLCTLLAILNVAAFITQRPKYARLKVRQSLLVIVSFVGLIFQLNSGPLVEIIDFFDVPCWLRLSLMVLVPSLFGGPIVARLAIFVFMTRFANSAVDEHRQPIPWKDDPDETDSLQPKVSRVGAACSTFWIGIKASFWPFKQKDVADRQRFLAALKFLVSPSGIVVITLILELPFFILVVILIGTQPAYIAGCHGCLVAPMVPAFIGICIFIMLIGCIIAVQTLRFPDPWGLAREASMCLVVCIIPALGLILSIVDEDDLSPFSWQYFQSIGFFLVLFVQTGLQVLIARRKDIKLVAPSTRRLKNRDMEGVTIATAANQSNSVQSFGGRIHMGHIFNNPVLSEAFEKHLVSELAVESFLYIRSVREWLEAYSDVAPSARLARARKIVRLYAKDDSLYQVNLPAFMFEKLRRILNDGLVDAPKDHFDESVREITKLLNGGAIYRFCRTKEFSDLVAGMDVEAQLELGNPVL